MQCISIILSEQRQHSTFSTARICLTSDSWQSTETPTVHRIHHVNASQLYPVNMSKTHTVWDATCIRSPFSEQLAKLLARLIIRHIRRIYQSYLVAYGYESRSPFGSQLELVAWVDPTFYIRTPPCSSAYDVLQSIKDRVDSKQRHSVAHVANHWARLERSSCTPSDLVTCFP